ncbi:MAG: bifunctional 2-C-methyl-D-erythritol 4-phosphate cytidylyltransferase/2-C-methyl-D-erythritol 2,4-cyclodiphosphate synthase [Rhodospirillales bacterium]|nr:bifunctional 2-C-methyl-D-erythritol 4-phosphate cytidylyltransferase/2-C-methyl-D-erythritol 2,4-cyclodiphosphate synthase [Rhodospirillales bacterium]
MSVAVLIVAAGRGTRVGSALPKQYLPVAGEPLLRHTVQAFALHPGVDLVRVVIHPDDQTYYDAATAGLDLLDPAPGGDSRQDSSRLGLESFAELAPDRILIHDGARPFPDSTLIDRVIGALDQAPGAVAALPVSDTLKRATSDGCAGETVDRSGLWRAQTPQGFHYQAILKAHRDLAGQTLTDDAAVAERAGLKVHLVTGSEENFKVTEPADIARAERHLGQFGGETRVGSGFDVHRFGPGDHVTLCGIAVPHDCGLLGHSDADVAMHAATDAILGALGAGDIGSHFPPSDPQWKGAPSTIFLEKAGSLVAAAHARISNLDVTIICEAPKVGPHRDAMTARLADILGITRDRVSVKATTTEQLGFTGRGEGIAAQATATVQFSS